MSDGSFLERRSFLRAFGAAALVRPLESALGRKNSGLFYVPVTGPERGRPSQFASLPCEAEATGPAFAPGESALFLSVQHPGERHGTRFSTSAAPRGSNWPARRVGFPPQPAVVAMRRR